VYQVRPIVQRLRHLGQYTTREGNLTAGVHPGNPIRHDGHRIGEEGASRPPSSHTTVRTVPYTAVPVVRRFVDIVACCPVSAQPYLTDSVRYFRL